VHVALLNTLYPPVMRGGAERSVETLASLLRDSGVRVSIITCGVETIARQVDVHHLPMPHRNPWSAELRPMGKVIWHARDITNPVQAKRVAALLRTLRPDIVHTHNLAGIGVGAWREARSLRIPVVHTLRDYYLMCLRSTLYSKGAVCHNRCLSCSTVSRPRQVYADAEVGTVIGISEHILNRHVDCGYFGRVSRRLVIRNPNVSAPSSGAMASTNEAVATRNQAVVYVGQLTPEKGVHVLAQAFLDAGNPKGRLYIAGQGPPEYQRRLDEIVRGDNRVRFLGRMPWQEAMALGEIVAVPSLWEEPFGRVVAEASSMGRYVLFSDIGGLPEAAMVSEAAGEAVMAGSVHAWSCALNRAMRGERKPAVKTNAAVLSSEETVLQEHLKAYRELMRRGT